MAQKDNAKQWFKEGDYPSENQFAQVFDWLRWKDEKIAPEDVDGLIAALQTKVSQQTLQGMLESATGKALPVPTISLKPTMVLPHSETVSIDTMMNGRHSYPLQQITVNVADPNTNGAVFTPDVQQDIFCNYNGTDNSVWEWDTATGTYIGCEKNKPKGNVLANGNIKIEVSYPHGSCDFFLSHHPMIFIEVYQKKKKRFVHSLNYEGALNRSFSLGGKKLLSHSNYGGGGSPLNQFISEFDLIKNNQIIEIKQKELLKNPSCVLPQQANNLTNFFRSGYTNNYKQPFNIRFACIDTDGRSVLLSAPSKTYYIEPVKGYFIDENEYYYYDWRVVKK